MSSRRPTDEALEEAARIDEMKKIHTKNSPPIPHLLQAQQAPALPYAKVVGRPGTGSYPALPYAGGKLTPTEFLTCNYSPSSASNRRRQENASSESLAATEVRLQALSRKVSRMATSYPECQSILRGIEDN